MSESAEPTGAQLERRMLAIMASDVVGYSRQMEADEAGTIARVAALRTEVLTPLLARHRGRLVKLMGDGALAVFESVVDAVACAAAVQRAVAERNAVRPDAERLVLRIGVNLGDVVLLEDDVYGDGVNVAARLEQLAEPGGVMVSGTAFDHLQGKLGFPLEFAGEQRVKNIERPVRAYRARLDGGAPRRRRLPSLRLRPVALLLALLVAAGLGTAFWWTLPAAASRPPVSVEAFHHVAGDEASARLATTLPQEIATLLARFRTVEVLAHDITGQRQARSGVLSSLGDLTPRYLLSGTVQREGAQVRLGVQLVELEHGREVWADRWDRPVSDLLALQTDLAETVASRIASPYSGAITAAERDLARAKPARSRSAHDLYLLGIEARERGSAEDLGAALALLKQSAELEPDFAPAYAGLAHTLGDIAAAEDYPAEWGRLRESAARKAVELDPLDPMAHAALAAMYADKGEPARARAEFEKALALNPASADLLVTYAGWASDIGEAQQGVEAAERALRLAPAMPAWAVGNVAYASFMSDDYARALRLIDGLPEESYTPAVYVYRAAALAALGRGEEARRAVEEALARNPGLSVERFAHDYGTTEEQRRRLTGSMRQAGFPLCAGTEDVAARPTLLRLPECTAS